MTDVLIDSGSIRDKINNYQYALAHTHTKGKVVSVVTANNKQFIPFDDSPSFVQSTTISKSADDGKFC